MKASNVIFYLAIAAITAAAAVHIQDPLLLIAGMGLICLVKRSEDKAELELAQIEAHLEAARLDALGSQEEEKKPIGF